MDKKVIERLKKLAALGGGTLTPDAVVKDAKSVSSPLHTHFEWDDDVAANKFRLDQARRLIRSVRVDVEIDEIVVSTVRYVHDPEAGDGEQGYVEAASLRGDVDLAREALANELARVKAALDRARSVAVALGLEGDVVDLEDRVAIVLAKIAA